MKTSTKFLALFFLLSALTTSPFPKPAFADQSPEPVFDIVGETVLTNRSYYVYHYHIFDNAKALTLAFVNHTCPLGVVLSENPNTALPLKFFPAKPGDDNVVYTSTDLNLEFFNNSHGDCKEYSTVWSLASNNYISTGGIVGNYGNLSTFNNWFNIVKPFPKENRYYFNFSTSIINPICPCCQDSEIGTINHDPHGYFQLGLSEKPLEVVFERADDDDDDDHHGPHHRK